jgi:cytochrome c553
MKLNKMIILKLAIAALILIFGFFGFIYSGWYNVAATEPHSAPVEWVLRTVMENSVRRHSRNIKVPAEYDLRDRALAEKAIGHYSAACATCHAAPGRAADPWVKIYPEAPDLTKPEYASRWSDRELFWIIKHGIKDTGMLALGPTHKDEDIWAVTAFVRQLPEMSAQDYRAMIERYEASRNPQMTSPPKLEMNDGKIEKTEEKQNVHRH